MFVEITRGRSFKGLAQYCLHDVRHSDEQSSQNLTSERVQFVETRNLATDNPQVAWRTMAATHYMQDELKERAGVGKGGRKDGKPVGHLLLGWRNDEAEAQQLDRVQMVAAANGALRAINANQNQAIIIAHNDTEHPHCHVIVNLIGEDGRLKKNWKEREKLSKFALEYEIKHHGEPIVKQREKNWEDREAGETPAPVKKQARHLFELEKAAQNDESLREFVEQHKEKLVEFERTKTSQTERHQKHRETLKWCLDERTRRTIAETEQQIRQSKTDIRKAVRQSWKEILERQETEREAFEERETSIKGSVTNALQQLDWRSILNSDGDERRKHLSKAFQILTSEAVRREHIQKEQQTEKDALRDQQRKKEEQQAQQFREAEIVLIRQHREHYVQKGKVMRDRQERSTQKLSQQQKELKAERDTILKQYRETEAAIKRQRVDQAEKIGTEFVVEQEISAIKSNKETGRIRRPRQERKARKPRIRKNEIQLQMKNATKLPTDQTKPETDQSEIENAEEFEKRMLEHLNRQQDRERFDDRER